MNFHPRSLYAKLSVLLLGLFLAAGAVTLIVTLKTSQLYQQEAQQRIHHDLAAGIVKEELLIENGEIAQDRLEHIFHMMMVINPAIELYLLDPRGKILAYSAPPGRVRLDAVNMAPIELFLTGRKRLPILGDDPRHPDSGNIFSVAPIQREGTLEGYLYIVLASEQFVSVRDALRSSFILRAGSWAVAGCVAVTLLAALLVSGRLTKRLSRLTRDMAVFRKRSLPSDAADSGGSTPEAALARDELDELRATFDRMAARIEQQISELEDQDRLRREMVANVSHDLRTPLTHLQGYLETMMLKEESLAPEERREYLEIALLNAKRLGRLVADLFELAKLDAMSEPLAREPFPVGELIQDVAQKYRLPAKEQGVALDATYEGGSAVISADLGLIERALENVLDNALRFTPEGGRINLSIKPPGPHDRWLKIEVEDTGSGIAASELPLIFDRFHRGNSSDNGEERRGAGLGLAIAKRVVELHGGSLHCESRVGAGTTFRFELPTSPTG